MDGSHAQPLGPQALKLASAGWVQVDGAWVDPRRPGCVPVLADVAGPDLDWSDYDAGRIERCSPDLRARGAHRAWRDRDGF